MGTTTDSWPELAVRGTALGDARPFEDNIRRLCAELVVEILGDPLPAVDPLVVADSGLYGEAIRQELGIKGEQTHTERQDYVGVAKTIPEAIVDGTVSNTVIVRAGVVAAAMGREGVEPLMPQWLGRYMLRHEFGHCVDHLNRGLRAPIGLTDAGEFSITRVSKYYQGILRDEIAACLLASSPLADGELTVLLQLDADPLQRELERVMERRKQYMLRLDTDLNGLAFDAAQVFWLVLMQYGKAFAHVTGAGRSSGSIGFPAVIAHRAGAIELFHEYATLVGKWSSQYPKWPVEDWPELHPLWERLGRAFGCVFEETPDGSALWLGPALLD